MKNFILYFFVVLFFCLGCADNHHFIDELEKLPNQGVFVPVYGTIQIDQSGGHLQGIQWYQDSRKNYFFLSGSSSEVAYLVRLELDGNAKTVSADTLSLAPYRHAGGFQIYGQYLAVGIEDNRLRNTSRIEVYDLRKEEDTWSVPWHTIHRNGNFERVTAGAVGMTEIDHQNQLRIPVLDPEQDYFEINMAV